jgi:hypothetical protein
LEISKPNCNIRRYSTRIQKQGGLKRPIKL